MITRSAAEVFPRFPPDYRNLQLIYCNL